MDIKVEQKDDVVVLLISGELSIYTKDELEKVVKEYLDKGIFKFVFELTNISYIDSSGLSLIILVGEKTRKHQQRVALVNPNPQVKYVIDLARIEEILSIHDSVDDAISNFN